MFVIEWKLDSQRRTKQNESIKWTIKNAFENKTIKEKTDTKHQYCLILRSFFIKQQSIHEDNFNDFSASKPNECPFLEWLQPPQDTNRSYESKHQQFTSTNGISSVLRRWAWRVSLLIRNRHEQTDDPIRKW